MTNISDELSQAKYAALMLDLMAARIKGEDEENILNEMDQYQQPKDWKPFNSPAFTIAQFIDNSQFNAKYILSQGKLNDS